MNEDDLAENWRRLLANQAAIRGLLWWAVVLLVVLVAAVGVSAYAIVTAINYWGA